MSRRPSRISAFAAFLAAIGISSAQAATVFDVDDVFGGNNSVIGTITTDGHSSVSASDITAWDLTVTVGTHTISLVNGHSTLTLIGGPLKVTGNELEFPTTPGVHGLDINDFPARSFFDVFVDIDIPFLGSFGGATWESDRRLGGEPNASANLLIATTTSSLVNPVGTTPLPAALPLFAVGLGVLGFVANRRKRKATAGAVLLR
jgi:hypothetical protein